jgi:predicted metal-dependent phosphotriesterase family hydrolase
MYVDGLVKAVEVKANINGNAVKVMEGVAKMIAATKAGINVQQNSLTVSGAELDEILSRQEPGDDLD